MKALTLTQPWATLVALGAKSFETRSWPTSHRGPVAIHAAKGLGPVGGAAGLVQCWWREPFHTVLAAGGYQADLDRCLPRGAIVAIVDLTECFGTSEVASLLHVAVLNGEEKASREFAFGNYDVGRFAFFLENLRPLDEPVECRGALSLWDVPADLLPLIESRAREPEAVSPTEGMRPSVV